MIGSISSRFTGIVSPFLLYLWYCTDLKEDFRLIIVESVTRVFGDPESWTFLYPPKP